MEKIKMYNGKNIEVGQEINFFDLWDGDGDEEELLESGCVEVAEVDGVPVIAGFEIIAEDEKNPLLKITELY